jgi:hypothetical protein
MKRNVAAALTVVLLLELPLWAGLGSKKTLYVGGTVSNLKERTEGTSSAQDEKQFVFKHKGGTLSIPYEHINSLEYGQKAGRRVGVAIVLSPFALFSKKRKHFLTIGYLDENDKQQAAVFELGKDIVRVTLATIEARTGQKIEYQDEEARKSTSKN